MLKKEIRLSVNIMDRRFIEYPDGKEDEINIYGEGLIKDKRVYIVGESKPQLGRRDVEKFCRLVKRVEKVLPGKILPVIITHLVRPRVEKYALEKIENLRQRSRNQNSG